MHRRRGIWLPGALLLPLATLATQTGQSATQPEGVLTTRQIHLTLHEGTLMAAALSPDGRTLAIDLLGSLWTLPATGGIAVNSGAQLELDLAARPGSATT